MKEFSLAECGLETVSQACQRKGWAPKTLQNWIARELIAVATFGRGRGTYLLRIADVDELVPPVREDGRGRPLTVRKTRGRKKAAASTPEPSTSDHPTPASSPRNSRRRRG